jgi:hypothetical protein
MRTQVRRSCALVIDLPNTHDAERVSGVFSVGMKDSDRKERTSRL